MMGFFGKKMSNISVDNGFSFNRIPVMAPILAPLLGVLFYGGISPLKIGLSVPSLERAQLRSKARVFLYT
jgi:hypothetical protein